MAISHPQLGTCYRADNLTRVGHLCEGEEGITGHVAGGTREEERVDLAAAACTRSYPPFFKCPFPSLDTHHQNGRHINEAKYLYTALEHKMGRGGTVS